MMLSRTNEGLRVLVNMLVKARKTGLYTPDQKTQSVRLTPPSSKPVNVI